MVFASRRKAAAHGDFSRILIVEQFHGYVVNDVYDLVKLMNNKIASFDQYTKASNFIINVINEFNKKYSHSQWERCGWGLLQNISSFHNILEYSKYVAYHSSSKKQ